MSATDDKLKEIKASLAEKMKDGKWVPQPGDPLYECDFIKVGFRAWGLEAPDKSWRLNLSRLDFGSKDPTAFLEVFAPNHVNAFGDLGWSVFTSSIGVNGGGNFTGAIKRLVKMLGASEIDWELRLNYLLAMARRANAGASNGTFSTSGRPVVGTPPPFVFDGRMREGRTISIFGAGSAGKTTLVDGLIASACSGIEIIPGWRPTRQFRVLVLDWDEGAEEETIRLAAICEAYQIELTGGYHYKRQSRPLHDNADELGSYVVANAIDMTVVTPMGRAQRNFGENITAPVDEVHEILRSFGTSNILIDHVTGDNMKGGALREFGSVRKRDNVRGSYGIDVQFEEPGLRVLVMRNTKSDPLAPKQSDQAVRIEYGPPWPKPDGTYDTITFRPAEIETPALGVPVGGVPMRVQLHALLGRGHLTLESMELATGYEIGSIKSCLYRNKSWFARLPSGAWEVLPVAQ